MRGHRAGGGLQAGAQDGRPDYAGERESTHHRPRRPARSREGLRARPAHQQAPTARAPHSWRLRCHAHPASVRLLQEVRVLNSKLSNGYIKLINTLTLMTPITCYRMGLECEKDQVGVDVFQLGGAHADLASLGTRHVPDFVQLSLLASRSIVQYCSVNSHGFTCTCMYVLQRARVAFRPARCTTTRRGEMIGALRRVSRRVSLPTCAAISRERSASKL